MRKLSFFLTFAMVLGLACGAFAQTHYGIVSVDSVTNPGVVDPVNHLMCNDGTTHTIYIRFNFLASPNDAFWGTSNGWQLYSPDGANWVNLLRGDGPLVTALGSGVTRYRKYYKSANNGATFTQTGGPPLGSAQPGPSTGPNDRVGYMFATLSSDGSDGFTGGVSNDIAVTLTFYSISADSGKTMCFDSASTFVAWEWPAAITGSDFPLWDNGLGVSGPRCWTLEMYSPQSVEEIGSGDLPTSYGLTQNYPNPFNPSTRFDFALPKASQST